MGFLFLVLCTVLVLNFFLIRLMPGNIADILAPDEYGQPEVRAAVLKEFGLDQPMWTQFYLYVKNTLTFKFGLSFMYYPTPVADLIREAAPRTMILVITSQTLAVLIGYFFGVEAGWRAGSKKDSFITGTSLTIWAAPMFWVAMMVLFVACYQLGWFPLAGYRDVTAEYANKFEYIIDVIYHMVMPVFTYVVCRFGAAQLIMRNTITITLKENYITTAEAKGISERRVKHRHAGRNALLPLVTSTIMGIGMAFSGSIFIEKIFSYPGMGRLIFNAVMNSDYPLIQGTFLISAMMIVVIIFALDFVYSFLDPRVRYK